MKRALGIVLVAMITSSAAAQAPPLEHVGMFDNINLYIDSQSIRRVEYPHPFPGRIGGTRTAAYTEVWIKGQDAAGVQTGQYLWTFDCNGRAAEMASVSPKSTQDVTAKAHQIGVEPWMTRIPPDSLYSIVEKRVCRK